MITNGSLAEVYCVIAKTSDNKFSCFLVDMKMPGFKFGPLEDFMGLRGCPVGTLFFDNIVLPKNHILGKEGEGLIIGNSAHYDARIYMGGLLAGAVKHAMDVAIPYSLQRKSGSEFLTELFPTQEKISNVAITHENILLLTRESVRLRNSGQNYANESTMIKAYGSKAAFKAIDDCI